MSTRRDNARQLRRNMTVAERHLWREIRCRRIANLKFRRQMPLGPYIVDFVCFEIKLVIEVDGEQHAAQTEYDAKRTEWLQKRGFHVIRFWNREVLENLASVLDAISLLIEESLQQSRRKLREGATE